MRRAREAHGYVAPVGPEEGTDPGEGRLVAWLQAQGVSDRAIADARRRGDLGPNLATDRLIRAEPTISVTEAAVAIEESPDRVAQVLTALGLAPDNTSDPTLTESEVDVVRTFMAAREVFGEREITHFARGLGHAMRLVAEAANEMFMAEMETPHITGGGDLPDLGEKVHSSIAMLEVAMGHFPTLLRAHLVRSLAMSRSARRTGGGVDRLLLVVGFVDLAGFTAATEEAEPTAVLDLALDFASAANDTVGGVGGRVVKMIGDEVMFTTLDGNAACDAALGLLRWAAELDAPIGARGGLALGPVIAHGCDHYGAVVNRAARLVQAASTGELLLDEAVAADTTRHVARAAGERDLKGFSHPLATWSLRA